MKQRQFHLGHLLEYAAGQCFVMYEYSFKFQNSTAHRNADALSRLPLPITVVETPLELVLLTEHVEDSSVTVDHICSWTRKDPVLAQVVQFLQQSWPSKCNPSLAVYFSKRIQLSLNGGCIWWES